MRPRRPNSRVHNRLTTRAGDRRAVLGNGRVQLRDLICEPTRLTQRHDLASVQRPPLLDIGEDLPPQRETSLSEPLRRL